MAFYLDNLIDINRLQKLYDMHLVQTGISSALIGLDGRRYAASGWKQICSISHETASEASALCNLAYNMAIDSLKSGESLVYYSCPFGLMHVVLPVRINDTHVANLLKGHFLFDKPSRHFIERFRKQVLKFGFDEERYLEALNKIPVIPEGKMKLMMDHSLIFAEMIGEMGCCYIKEHSIREEIQKAYLEIENEIRLRKSESDKLAQIIGANAIPTFAINSESIITHWNKACELITGYKACEVIGTQKHQDVFYPEKRPLLADFIVRGAPAREVKKIYGDKINESIHSPDAYEGEDFFPEMGTHGKTLFFTVAPLKESDGRVAGAISTLQDITEQRLAEHELKESEERYRHLFESANDAIFLIKDGVIRDCNQKAHFLFRSSRAELIGLCPIDLSPEIQPGGEVSKNEIKRKSEIVYQDVPMLFEWRFKRRDGTFFDAGVSISKIIISNTPYALSIIRDITNTKMLIEALKARESELDEKNLYLGKINSALKAALDHRDVERRSLEENIMSNMKKHVFPYISELARCGIGEHARAYLNVIETNLNSLISPYSNKVFSKYLDLTPTEIRVADLIRSGMNTKGIAEILGLSPSSVQWHRKNIRIKFGLSGKKVNLHSFIVNLQ